ncbi:peptide ABC transporter substrate-binding protein [Clostridium sp.]|uniref:peptide ABC transporter substrate-binding protein n=1 Tax=Clostridium sp. TaxID=1506 RepID=UPI0026DD2D95|nr:peptide ABC transporter substrate-binding protein [Clostridium sp.]MDO5039377.1 peptide ABC transporter substrate-binding protein [Clostridium sp.]
MKAKKAISTFLISGLIVILFTGCGSKSSTSSKNLKKLNLTTGAIKTMDSVKATDSESFNISQNTQETLLVYDNDKPVPGAAKSFEKSKDEKTYTFHLRDGLKWSDGKDLTSKDFKYAWMRMLDPNVAAGYSFFLFGVKNGENYFNGKAKAEDVGIRTPDDKTLVVELENPIPYFSQLVAFPALAPQRKDVVEKQGEEYGSREEGLVFSGPFMISNWQRGAKVELVKNPNYWNAKNIKLDEVNLTQINEANTQYQMFLSGQLDVMFKVNGEYIKELQKGVSENKWDEVSGVMPTVFYNQFNFKSNKILQNTKVRQALSIAINREEYTKDILKSGVPAYGLVPDGIVVGDMNYRKKVKEPLKEIIKEDPKKLFVEGLKELGLDPDPSKYNINFLLQGSSSSYKNLGEYLQNTWKNKIGVNIKLSIPADFSDFLRKEDSGEFDIAMAGWGADYNDPMTFLDLYGAKNGSNYGKYNDPKVNKLLEELQTEINIDKRLDMYKEIEKIEVAENPAVAPTYYLDIHSFQKKYVHGMQYPKFGGNYQLRWAYIE